MQFQVLFVWVHRDNSIDGNSWTINVELSILQMDYGISIAFKRRMKKLVRDLFIRRRIHLFTCVVRIVDSEKDTIRMDKGKIRNGNE